MNPQQKINDVTYLVLELNMELNKMIACVSCLEKTKDKLSKHYEELDWEEKRIGSQHTHRTTKRCGKMNEVKTPWAARKKTLCSDTISIACN